MEFIMNSNPYLFAPGDTDNHTIVFPSAKGGSEKVFIARVVSGSFRINGQGTPNAVSPTLSASGVTEIRFGHRSSKLVCGIQDTGGSGSIIISQIV